MAIATSAMVVFERRKMRASGTLAELRSSRARERHVSRRARGERARACSSDACAGAEYALCHRDAAA